MKKNSMDFCCERPAKSMLDVRRKFKNVMRQRELSASHCRGGVQIIFDSTLHKDDMHKS